MSDVGGLFMGDKYGATRLRLMSRQYQLLMIVGNLILP
jgi:hypothetical protein